MKPGIPATPPCDPTMSVFLGALRENVELLTGTRGGKLPTVSTSATLSDVITSLNAVINRLNGG